MTITNNNPFNVFNYEFKAKAANLAGMENELLNLHPVFAGEDYQVDTYFNTTTGRLKLREGNIENALIYYERKDDIEAKQSDVILYDHAPAESLKNILVKLHGIKVIVKKKEEFILLKM